MFNMCIQKPMSSQLSHHIKPNRKLTKETKNETDEYEKFENCPVIKEGSAEGRSSQGSAEGTCSLCWEGCEAYLTTVGGLA